MKAVDPRLLRHARAARSHLVVTVLLGLVVTGLILAQAALLAHALAAAALGTGAAALSGTLVLLLGVVVARGAAAYGGEAAALRAAATVKSQLRRNLTAHCLRLGPAWLGGQQPGQIAATATRGLDGLDPWFARYLPQLVLSVLVPTAVLVTVTAVDPISGLVIALTLPLIPLFAALVGLHTKYHASAEGAAAADSVFDILETPLPRRASPRTPVPDLRSAPIRLDRVTMAYPGRDLPALAQLSLTINPGELIVLTGPSGAGKSTLLRLLLRFTDPASGTVYAGGADLAAVPVDAWRAQIAWVPQHPRLFPGSVADNIALGQPGASRAAIEDAARLAGAADFIEALPDGYDTPLGERAAELSAGQRQQLALARAFLRDAPLLLLDEPSAHLAPAAAAAMDDVIRGAMAGRTIIVATHRDPGPAGASQVITLDSHRLAGPPSRPAGALATAAAR
jgi:ABC-type transport system involved in cytochrome bd biosynthesis fused ATPase/permease subunit